LVFIVVPGILCVPPIPLKQTIKAIKTEIAHLKKLGEKTNKAAITKLENLLGDIGNGRIVGGGTQRIPGTTIKTKGKQVFNQDANAVLFRDQRDMIDDLIDWTEKPGLKEINKSLIRIRTSMANEMLTQSVKSGDKAFEKNMKSLAKKLKAIDKLKLRLGSEETFVATLFGKNKSARQRALKEIDDVFGTNFSKDSNLAKIASEFGKKDFTTVDGKVALSVPRGKGFKGGLVSPRAAAGISNLVDLTAKGKLPADLAASGITQAQIGTLINFLERQSPNP